MIATLASLEGAKMKRHHLTRLTHGPRPPLDRISATLAGSLEEWEADALSALAQIPFSKGTPAIERLLELRLAEPALGSDTQSGYRVSLLGHSVLAILRQSS